MVTSFHLSTKHMIDLVQFAGLSASSRAMPVRNGQASNSGSRHGRSILGFQPNASTLCNVRSFSCCIHPVVRMRLYFFWLRGPAFSLPARCIFSARHTFPAQVPKSRCLLDPLNLLHVCMLFMAVRYNALMNKSAEASPACNGQCAAQQIAGYPICH